VPGADRKGTDALRAVKAFMLSTSGNSENIERSFGLGADFYAVKPTTFSGLKELLLKYCRQGKRSPRN
jgi:response regulator of citrate/malate metabolism